MHTCSPGTQQVDAGRSEVPGQPELHEKLVSKGKSKTKISKPCTWGMPVIPALKEVVAGGSL